MTLCKKVQSKHYGCSANLLDSMSIKSSGLAIGHQLSILEILSCSGSQGSLLCTFETILNLVSLNLDILAIRPIGSGEEHGPTSLVSMLKATFGMDGQVMWRSQVKFGITLDTGFRNIGLLPTTM